MHEFLEGNLQKLTPQKFVLQGISDNDRLFICRRYLIQLYPHLLVLVKLRILHQKTLSFRMRNKDNIRTKKEIKLSYIEFYFHMIIYSIVCVSSAKSLSSGRTKVVREQKFNSWYVNKAI